MSGIAVGGAFLIGAALEGWGVGLVAVGALLIVGLGRDRGSIVLAGVVVVVALLGAWRASPALEGTTPGWVDGARAVQGRVASVPTSNGRRQQLRLDAEAVRGSGGGTWEPVDGCVRVTAPLVPAMRIDDQVRVYGQVEGAEDQRPSYRAFLRAEGCGATMFAFAASVQGEGGGFGRWLAGVRQEVVGVLARVAPGDAGALLAGLVTGDDAALSRERRDAFLATGTTHLTAVSGSNIALVIAIAGTLGTASGWRRRLGWQLLTVAGVWGYAALVGLQPPAVRAATVATAALLAGRVGRRADHVTLVVLAGALLIAVRPSDLGTLSFRLSFASSLALAATLAALRPDGARGWAMAALLATSVAQVATMPILLPAFGTLHTVDVPANLLVGPVIAWLFPVAALVGVIGLVAPTVASGLALPAVVGTEVVFAVVDVLARAPGAEVRLPVFGGRTAQVVVIALAAAVVTAASAEGRRWFRRSIAGNGKVPRRVAMAATAGVVGFATAVVVVQWVG